MAIQTVAMRDLVVSSGYTPNAPYGGLSTTAPGGTAPTEVTGGSPAYARKPLSWGAPAASASTATAAVFDVASGVTVVGFTIHSAVTAGTYLDGVGITSTAFSSQGTLTVTPTYTQS